MRSTGDRPPAARRALALDLGSARTRAWVPGTGLVADLPSGVPHTRLPRTARSEPRPVPVRWGRVADQEACARLLYEIADGALGPERRDCLVVVSHPVLAGLEHREHLRTLVGSLGVGRVLRVDSARAAAAYAGAGSEGPLLVVDLGAGLTEATLLVHGAVQDARLAEIGLADLPAGSTPAPLVGTAASLVEEMWLRDRHGAVRGALRRGVLVTGGGALLPGLLPRLAARLGAKLRPITEPETAVVQGAALLADAAVRHPAGRRTTQDRPL
ncbi:rod shape-determining protein MreC [Streptomyces sp. NPDC058045]|uniref:rod shape-determining protein MreC n=1 Tax=Streptomyces sp. NPDC058045 TaxID=3346311 RepID=UPI0036E5B832